MRAITVRQPYATLIALGAKRIETRSWKTSHRGLLAIHSARRWMAGGETLIALEPFKAALYEVNTYPMGSVLAVVRLVDCERVTGESGRPPWPEASFGDYRAGRWMWHLMDVVRLPQPIPARGRQGLWNWNPPDELADWWKEEGYVN